KSMNAFLAGAGYQVLENNGVKALLDFVFGERELEDSVKQHKGYNEGVFTGNLLSLLQSGAEFIGGGLWLLGGTSGSLALAPATGGSSVSYSSYIWKRISYLGSCGGCWRHEYSEYHEWK
ncbi:hypothetical protein ACWOFR_08470, partial [Carnobacterium gallinarum]